MYDPEHDPALPPEDESPLSAEAAGAHALGTVDPTKEKTDLSKISKFAQMAGAGQGGAGAPPLPTASGAEDPTSPLMEDEKKKFNAGAGDSSGMAGQLSQILSLFAG